MSRKSDRAFGFCDRTGFRYDLEDLREQFVNGHPTGLMVGKDQLDIDHEQWRLDEVEANDDINLDDPRPDTSLEESRALTAFDPVGGGISEFGSRTVGLDNYATGGNVTIEVS